MVVIIKWLWNITTWLCQPLFCDLLLSLTCRQNSQALHETHLSRSQSVRAPPSSLCYSLIVPTVCFFSVFLQHASHAVWLSVIITRSGPPVIRWRRTSDKIISFKWLDVSLFPQAFIQVIYAYYALFSRSPCCLGNLSSAELPSPYIKTALAALAVAKKAFLLDWKNRKQKQTSHYRQTSLQNLSQCKAFYES